MSAADRFIEITTNNWNAIDRTIQHLETRIAMRNDNRQSADEATTLKVLNAELAEIETVLEHYQRVHHSK